MALSAQQGRKHFYRCLLRPYLADNVSFWPPFRLSTDDLFTKPLVLWPVSSLLRRSQRVLTMLWPGAFRNPVWLRRDRQAVGHTHWLHHMTSADPSLWRDQRGLAALIHVTPTLLSGSAFQWHINQPISPINFCLFVGSSEWRGHCLSCLGVFTQCSCSLCVLRVLKVV